MKLGVLADIHGNYEAFKACVDYCKKQKVNGFVLLGDYVGELPCPERTLSLIHELKNTTTCYVIKGNKEDYILEGLGDSHPEWDPYKSVVGMLRYAFDHTSKSDVEYFKTLPVSLTINIKGYEPIRICHGTPDNPKRKIVPDDPKNQELFDTFEEKNLLCAHSHRAFSIREYGKHVINPGSVGLPVDGCQCAQCMILHSTPDGWRPEYIEVPYDIEAEIKSMKNEMLFDIAPCWSIITRDILTGGTTPHSAVLRRAMSLCEQENGAVEWPCISEKYMAQAVNELLFVL